MSGHIGTLETRKYVRIADGRRFTPTRLGLALIQGAGSKVELGQRVRETEVELSGRGARKSGRHHGAPHLLPGLCRIDPELVEPSVRAHVEAQLLKIAQGELPRAAVVAHLVAEFTAKFVYFVEHVSRMEATFEAAYRQVVPILASAKSRVLRAE